MANFGMCHVPKEEPNKTILMATMRNIESIKEKGFCRTEFAESNDPIAVAQMLFLRDIWPARD
jgi:hypothetical protein